MAKRAKFSNTAKHGKADWARLRRMTDAEIERTAPAELPLLPEDFWINARVVVPPTKEAISFRVDASRRDTHRLHSWDGATERGVGAQDLPARR